jgi:hypothetical protein
MMGDAELPSISTQAEVDSDIEWLCQKMKVLNVEEQVRAPVIQAPELLRSLTSIMTKEAAKTHDQEFLASSADSLVCGGQIGGSQDTGTHGPYNAAVHPSCGNAGPEIAQSAKPTSKWGGALMVKSSAKSPGKLSDRIGPHTKGGVSKPPNHSPRDPKNRHPVAGGAMGGNQTSDGPCVEPTQVEEDTTPDADGDIKPSDAPPFEFTSVDNGAALDLDIIYHPTIYVSPPAQPEQCHQPPTDSAHSEMELCETGMEIDSLPHDFQENKAVVSPTMEDWEVELAAYLFGPDSPVDDTASHDVVATTSLQVAPLEDLVMAEPVSHDAGLTTGPQLHPEYFAQQPTAPKVKAPPPMLIIDWKSGPSVLNGPSQGQSSGSSQSKGPAVAAHGSGSNQDASPAAVPLASPAHQTSEKSNKGKEKATPDKTTATAAPPSSNTASADPSCFTAKMMEYSIDNLVRKFAGLCRQYKTEKRVSGKADQEQSLHWFRERFAKTFQIHANPDRHVNRADYVMYIEDIFLNQLIALFEAPAEDDAKLDMILVELRQYWKTEVLPKYEDHCPNV